MKTHSQISTLVDSQGQICNTSVEKARALNEQFSSVFTNDDSQIPTFPTFHGSVLLDANINEEIVEESAKNLSSSYALCPDGLPTIFFRKLAKAISKPLSFIFSCSLKLGKVPELWRRATVTPIAKKGNSKKPADYRPVSLTCTPCRLLETILRNEILTFLNENHLLSMEQHGFTSKHSTSTQMLECLYDWTFGLQRQKCIDVIYIDFAKAFDTVSHKKLLLKIKAMGVRGVLYDWLESYLTNRSQRVNVSGTFSEESRVGSGVPQGSVLGPLLFLIYINDLTQVLPPEVKIKLFADDCKIYMIFAPSADTDPTPNLKVALDRLYAWINTWQLRLAVEKCGVLHIGSNNPKKNYYIGGSQIAKCRTYRDLGIIMDDKLKFHQQVNTICTKAYQRINLILRTFITKDPNTLKWAYCVFVRPLLEYGSSIWAPITQGDVVKLEKVQAYFTRRALGYNNLMEQRPTYSCRLKQLRLPSLELRRLHLDLCFLYKMLNGSVETAITNRIEFLENRTRGHSFRFRVRNDTESDYSKHFRNPTNAIFKNFFLNRTIDIWNALPETVFDIPTTLTNCAKNKLFKLNLLYDENVKLDQYLYYKCESMQGIE